jgi:hypothetical protein
MLAMTPHQITAGQAWIVAKLILQQWAVSITIEAGPSSCKTLLLLKLCKNREEQHQETEPNLSMLFTK